MNHHYADFLGIVESCEESLRETVVGLKEEYDELGNKASRLLERMNKIEAKTVQVDRKIKKFTTFSGGWPTANRWHSPNSRKEDSVHFCVSRKVGKKPSYDRSEGRNNKNTESRYKSESNKRNKVFL